MRRKMDESPPTHCAAPMPRGFGLLPVDGNTCRNSPFKESHYSLFRALFFC